LNNITARGNLSLVIGQFSRFNSSETTGTTATVLKLNTKVLTAVTFTNVVGANVLD
jgi:hypothetical protein